MVKVAQIAGVGGDEANSPALFALDTAGNIWVLIVGKAEWAAVPLPASCIAQEPCPQCDTFHRHEAHGT
jgi:hypothetical protein